MKSFKHHYFYYPFFMLLTVFFLFFSGTIVSAAVKTSDLETVPWSMVTESSIINEKGWLQSMCATDQYIVCLVKRHGSGHPDCLLPKHHRYRRQSRRTVQLCFQRDRNRL